MIKSRIYLDTEHNSIITEKELQDYYLVEYFNSDEHESFEHYLNACMTYNGGTLRRI